MNRPEDALIPLVAAAVLMQMLASAPMRVEALFPPADAPREPFVQTVFDLPESVPPHAAPTSSALVRDEDDHFSGAS